VTSLYASLNERTRGTTLDQMRPALRAWLAKHTEPELARLTYVEELMKTSARADIVIPALRTEVSVASAAPALGPATAAVTIVAFGDLQSNEYVRLAQEFTRARETFGARLRIVYKPLPTFGPASAAVAQAAACAHAQGRFWPYHDAAMKPGSLEGARLSTIAADVGLDGAAFERCRQSADSQSLPQRAVDDAGRYGISGSPAFVVNGRFAPEPPPFLPPFEYLKRLVEEELQRQAREAAGR
jgi:protein-disulfide isomerase